jgi:hypothetical protein
MVKNLDENGGRLELRDARETRCVPNDIARP